MAVRRWRIALLVIGLGLLVLGGVVLLQEVSPRRYVGILTWFAGALIVHDGIIAPLVVVVGVVSRRVGARVPAVAIAIVQAALVVAGVVVLLVVPEILKQAIGTLSSSILPQDYGLHLAVFLVVVAVLTALAVGFYAVVLPRRQKLREPADQT